MLLSVLEGQLDAERGVERGQGARLGRAQLERDEAAEVRGQRGRLEAMRWVLSQLDYEDKDQSVVSTPDPLIVGPPSEIYEDEELTGKQYPPLP